MQPVALLIEVTKACGAADRPIGRAKLAKSELTEIGVKRQSLWKGKTIGLIVRRREHGWNRLFGPLGAGHGGTRTESATIS